MSEAPQGDSGFFRYSCLRPAEGADSNFLSAIPDLYPPTRVVEDGSGWYCIFRDKTVSHSDSRRINKRHSCRVTGPDSRLINRRHSCHITIPHGRRFLQYNTRHPRKEKVILCPFQQSSRKTDNTGPAGLPAIRKSTGQSFPQTSEKNGNPA